jgi:hypothetical protein
VSVVATTDDPGSRGKATRPGLPGPARLYLVAVGLAVAVAAAFLPNTSATPEAHGLGTFAVLATCAAVAQLFVVRIGGNQLYHVAIAFVVAAALLLPPALVALMCVVQHVPDWIKERYPWYIQTFNIGNFTLNALAAWGTARLIVNLDAGSVQTRWALAGLGACSVFVAMNHLLLATMLRLARGLGFRRSGLFEVRGLLVDVGLACLGLALAAFWGSNSVLIVATLAPLVLVQRSLRGSLGAPVPA